MAKITRRGALSSIAAVPAIGSMAMAETVDDPLIRAINEYRAGVAEFRAVPEGEVTQENEQALIDRTYASAEHVLMENPPQPSSIEGVRAAIRLAFEEHAFACRMSENVMRSALEYLDVTCEGQVS